jgi:alkylation response protein AidB-like acyl-CoA dehydrogenase
MDFSLNENQKMIAQMVRDFAQKEILPYRNHWDEKQIFPVDVFKKMGELGLMGVLVPEEYGGSGFGYNEYVTAITEVSKVCGGIGLSMAAHNSLCTNHILYFGSEEQKRKYLPKLASAEFIGAWGLTEPSTGSDAGNMRTTAVRDGDGWVINGSKTFITHGISGDVVVLMTRTGKLGEKNNATAFLIDKGTPGFTSGKKEDKLGMRASETAELIFQDCKIPDSCRLGEVGSGFKQALAILDGGRISIASLGLGIAKGAYEAALKYSKERQQFGKSISDFQAVAFKLADMATKIDAAEMLIFRAAYLKNNHLPVSKESAMAKYYSSEIAVEVANDGVQIHGGYGYIKDFPAEKFYRDAKLCTIGEGTSEIQKVVISREILK